MVVYAVPLMGAHGGKSFPEYNIHVVCSSRLIESVLLARPIAGHSTRRSVVGQLYILSRASSVAIAQQPHAFSRAHPCRKYLCDDQTKLYSLALYL